MDVMNGPQWRQLPLLMTHEEVAGLHSTEFGVQVSELKNKFRYGSGNRGYSGTGDLPHVQEIQDRIKEHGYDERYPLVVNPVGHGDQPDVLRNGNHRAAAVVEMKHPLTPVTFQRQGAMAEQYDTEKEDILSGRQKPLKYGQYGLPKGPRA